MHSASFPLHTVGEGDLSAEEGKRNQGQESTQELLTWPSLCFVFPFFFTSGRQINELWYFFFSVVNVGPERLNIYDF